MQNRILSLLKVLVLALVLSLGVSYAIAAGAPAGGPPNCPASNDACNAPIHVGANEQTKTGRLNVSNAIWGDFLASKGNAYINDRLGIALGAPGGVANPPTANLDVAGTVRFRGDVANPPAAGKVLTSSDNNGNAVWRAQMDAGSKQIQTGWFNVPYGSACSGVVVPFTTAFPAGAKPVVFMQPMWMLYSNNDPNTSWSVSNITNTGFKVNCSNANDPTGGYGEDGIMWTAIYDPSNPFEPSSFNGMSCRAVVEPLNGSSKTVKWYLTAPNAHATLRVRLQVYRDILTGTLADPYKTIPTASTKVENLIASATYPIGSTKTGDFTVVDYWHTVAGGDAGNISCTVNVI